MEEELSANELNQGDAEVVILGFDEDLVEKGQATGVIENLEGTPDEEAGCGIALLQAVFEERPADGLEESGILLSKLVDHPGITGQMVGGIGFRGAAHGGQTEAEKNQDERGESQATAAGGLPHG